MVRALVLLTLWIRWLINYTAFALLIILSYDLTFPLETSAQLTSNVKRKKKASIHSIGPDTQLPIDWKVSIIDSPVNVELQLLSDDDPDIAHVFQAEILTNGRENAWLSPSDFVFASGGSVLAIEGNHQAKEALEVVSTAPLFAILRGIPTDSKWVQNYWGLIAESSASSSKYTICGFDLNQVERPLDAQISERFAATKELPHSRANLKMQASSIVALRNGDAVVSHRILLDNPSLSLREISRELRRIGITRPIWSPSLPAEPGGHMDMCIGFINGYVVVPTIAPEAARFSTVPEIVAEARSTLDKIASIVEASGYPVVRLMMPAPAGFNASGLLPYYTPVNWLAVRANEAENPPHVSLAIPVPFIAHADRELVPFYAEFNEKTFRRIDARGHYIGTTLPEFGGAFKCISGRVPRKLLV